MGRRSRRRASAHQQRTERHARPPSRRHFAIVTVASSAGHGTDLRPPAHHPRLRPRPRRRHGDGRRGAARNPAGHHHRRRKRAARIDHPERDRDPRPVGHRCGGARRSQPTARRAAATRRLRARRERARRRRPPRAIWSAGQPRRDRLHHRHRSRSRRRLVGSHRTVDQHRPRVALGARHRRPPRGDLVHGRRTVREPHGDRRVQHLGGSRGCRDGALATAGRW